MKKVVAYFSASGTTAEKAKALAKIGRGGPEGNRSEGKVHV